jgi:adenylate cyclase
MAAANPLVEWILAEGWEAPSLPDLVRGLCQQMLAVGLPLCRMRLHVRTLHPQYLGTSYTWTRGRAEIEEFNATYAILNAECYQASPFKAIFDDGVGGVRRRLDIPGLALDYPVLEELRAEGATDYVAMPIVFSDARRSAITCAADRPGGFATEELEAIYGMLPVLSRLLEVHALRRTARTILETYLGRVSGDRVLKGLVRRGDGEDIDAVIWFSDLRGSTPLADVLPRPVFLELLNGYFEAMAGSVLAHDGEVLRYIGDALLAIFPLGNGNGSNGNNAALHPALPAAACSRALGSARGDRADGRAQRAPRRPRRSGAPLRDRPAYRRGDVRKHRCGSAAGVHRHRRRRQRSRPARVDVQGPGPAAGAVGGTGAAGRGAGRLPRGPCPARRA